MRGAQRLLPLLRRASTLLVEAGPADHRAAQLLAADRYFHAPCAPSTQIPDLRDQHYRWYDTSPSSASISRDQHEDSGASPAFSTDDADKEAGEEGSHKDDLQTKILDAALPHVAELGWSMDALRAACTDLQLSQAAAGVVERGPGQLVQHFNVRCNRQLEAQLAGQAEELAVLRVHERVAAGAKLRLQMVAPYIDLWPQALALQAQPASLLATARQYAEIADIIWHAAGDTSTECNWYTKRGLLAGCYVATELYMLNDCSPDYDDTWAALGRRLQDVMAVGKAAGQAGSAAGAAADAAGAALQQVAALLGRAPRRG